MREHQFFSDSEELTNLVNNVAEHARAAGHRFGVLEYGDTGEVFYFEIRPENIRVLTRDDTDPKENCRVCEIHPALRHVITVKDVDGEWRGPVGSECIFRRVLASGSETREDSVNSSLGRRISFGIRNLNDQIEENKVRETFSDFEAYARAKGLEWTLDWSVARLAVPQNLRDEADDIFKRGAAFSPRVLRALKKVDPSRWEEVVLKVQDKERKAAARQQRSLEEDSRREARERDEARRAEARARAEQERRDHDQAAEAEKRQAQARRKAYERALHAQGLGMYLDDPDLALGMTRNFVRDRVKRDLANVAPLGDARKAEMVKAVARAGELKLALSKLASPLAAEAWREYLDATALADVVPYWADLGEECAGEELLPLRLAREKIARHCVLSDAEVGLVLRLTRRAVRNGRIPGPAPLRQPKQYVTLRPYAPQTGPGTNRRPNIGHQSHGVGDQVRLPPLRPRQGTATHEGGGPQQDFLGAVCSALKARGQNEAVSNLISQQLGPYEWLRTHFPAEMKTFAPGKALSDEFVSRVADGLADK